MVVLGAGGAREVCLLPTSASDQLPAPVDSCSWVLRAGEPCLPCVDPAAKEWPGWYQEQWWSGFLWRCSACLPPAVSARLEAELYETRPQTPLHLSPPGPCCSRLTTLFLVSLRWSLDRQGHIACFFCPVPGRKTARGVPGWLEIPKIPSGLR